VAYYRPSRIIRHQPRVMFIGFLETDAWGHAGRYYNLLTSAHVSMSTSTVGFDAIHGAVSRHNDVHHHH
jgi:hypothetical protein